MNRESNRMFRQWLGAALAAAAATVASAFWLDKSAALYFDRVFRPTAAWVVLSRLIHLYEMLVAVALFVFVGAGAARMRGKSLRTRGAFQLSMAILATVGCEAVLRAAFGRGSPDPTFLRWGASGFHLLHGRTGWESFPSGTAAVAFAMAGALWQSRSRGRVAGAILAMFVAIAVVALNWHWLSDAIAGAFLGAWVGVTTVLLLAPPADR